MREKNNGCRIYVDIVKWKNCSQFKLLFLLLFIGKFVNPGGEGNGIRGEGRLWDRYFIPKLHFINEYDNLV